MKKFLTAFVITSALTIPPVISCDKGDTLRQVSHILKYIIRKIDEGIYPVTTVEVKNALDMYNNELRDACQKCKAHAYLQYQMLINRLERFNTNTKNDAQNPGVERAKSELTGKIIEIINQKNTCTKAQTLPGIDQTKILALTQENLSHLSLEELFKILNDLGQDLIIKVIPKGLDEGSLPQK